jgi:hypothetical protein
MFNQKRTQNKGGYIYFLLKRSLMQSYIKKIEKKLKIKEKKRRSAKTNKNIQDLCYETKTSELIVTYLY